MSRTVTALPDDAAALKALVRELQASLYAHDLLIRSLRAQIARLKKQKFGASSEKIAREIEQLELTLEGLEIAKSETSDEPPSEMGWLPPSPDGTVLCQDMACWSKAERTAT
jgi:hypothetical protein